ncbi:MAG: hypothetical protein C4589_06610 [Peptococcaceae bacterium]|nr:MAG: hypothetical protein C4589_06610 [Peptococcaceae bacterium]
MRRCGDCKNFMNCTDSSASDNGYCIAFLDDDGIGKEVGVYDDAGKCQQFIEQDRIRTNVSEFMSDPTVRVARGFDEK